MYKPKKYVRLDKLPKTPRLPDIRNLLNEAKKARACTVELPWRSEKLGLPFSLTVRVEVGGGEPIWTLYEGEGNSSRVMWSTGFDDVELLYDVLTLSLPSDGPNIFAPTEETPAGKGVAAAPERAPLPKADMASNFSSSSTTNTSSEFSLDRSYESSSSDSGLMKPSDLDASGYFKKKEAAKYPPHLLTPEPEAPVSASASQKESAAGFAGEAKASEPQPTAQAVPHGSPSASPEVVSPPVMENPPAQQVQPPAPTVAPTAVPQNVQPPMPGPQPMPQQPFVPQAEMPPGYGYPPGYPYAPYQNPYMYPPGYAYPPGYGASPYPYNPNMMPGQLPYGQPALPVDPVSAASTVPLGSGTGGYAVDPFAPNVVAPHHDLVKRRPNIMLGTFLVDAGLVPKATIDAALQVQTLVSQGTLSAIKAAEAVRRAHLRGCDVEPDEADIRVKPGDAVVRVKPQIGQVLVMAGIITASQLKTALGLQDVLRSGNISMEEAIEKLAQTSGTAMVKREGIDDETIGDALNLLRNSGLISVADLESATAAGGELASGAASMLVSGGKIEQVLLDSALSCQKHIAVGKLKVEEAVQALHYCERMRVPLKVALQELGISVLS